MKAGDLSSGDGNSVACYNRTEVKAEMNDPEARNERV